MLCSIFKQCHVLSWEFDEFCIVYLLVIQCSILIIKRPDDLFVLSSKVLFQHKDSRWPLVIGENDDVAQRVKDYYNLSINAAVMFRRYSETWSEWVDVLYYLRECRYHLWVKRDKSLNFVCRRLILYF